MAGEEDGAEDEQLLEKRLDDESSEVFPRIGPSLPNKQRQHRTLRIQKDVLPYALC